MYMKAPSTLPVASTIQFQNGSTLALDAFSCAQIPAADVDNMLAAGFVPYVQPKNKVVVDATAGNVTFTGAQFANADLVTLMRSGHTTPTDVLPTAAQLVAAMANPQVGDTSELVYNNSHSGTATLTVGAGNTMAVNTVATGKKQRWMVTITDVATPAVTYLAAGTYGS